MPKTQSVLTRVSPELKRKLRALAKSTKRSESYLAAEAIADYVAVNEWQMREISQAKDEADRGEPGVPHDEMVRWLKSWGTKQEMPPPKLEKKR